MNLGFDKNECIIYISKNWNDALYFCNQGEPIGHFRPQCWDVYKSYSVVAQIVYTVIFVFGSYSICLSVPITVWREAPLWTPPGV